MFKWATRIMLDGCIPLRVVEIESSDVVELPDSNNKVLNYRNRMNLWSMKLIFPDVTTVLPFDNNCNKG